MFRSIRWRLVTSYALLTLFTVILVGVLALTLVRSYMIQGERDYLTANAEAVARQIEPLWPALSTSDFPQEMTINLTPPVLTELVETSAFLGNVRVRVLAVDGRVLADSGRPRALHQIAWITPSLFPSNAISSGMPISHPHVALDFIVALPSLSEIPSTSRAGQRADTRDEDTRLWLRRSTQLDNASVLIMRTEPSQWGNRFIFELEGVEESLQLRPTTDSNESPQALLPGATSHGFTLQDRIGTPDSELSTPIALPHKGEADGLLVASDDTPVDYGDQGIATPLAAPVDEGGSTSDSTAARSMQVVTVPIGDTESPKGYVELSEGPDFGTEALNAIRRAFLIAAGGVSLLSVLVGLLIGQGLTAPLMAVISAARRMSGGDLSSRAPVQSSDETGMLARQFNQMAHQLEASFATLAAERDTLRRFITDASHELRTPIMALQTFTELLQGPAARDAVAQAEFLAESQRQIERMEWITTNLLDLSRLDGGLIKLTLCSHDVGMFLTGAVAPFRARVEQSGVHLSIVAPSDPIFWTVDQARLELALSNLIDNAVKFTPEGGRIKVGAHCAGDRLHIGVEDSGIGIAHSDIPHVFDRFYRGQKTERGSGLGLAIAKAIVEAHGGSLYVESEVGVGSRFVIELPAN